MASELAGREDGSRTELAKPLHLQYLERALRLDSFLRQTAAIFNRDISSDESDDGLEDSPSLHQSSDPIVRVKEEPLDPGEDLPDCCAKGSLDCPKTLTGKLNLTESKPENGALYNFSKLKRSRKWLKGILVSDDSTDSDSDTDADSEDDVALGKDELQDMLRLHKYKKVHQNKYNKDGELQQYQYYSTGLLATHDPFYEQQRHLLGPKRKKIKEEKKLKAKLKKVKKKKRRDEEFSSEESPRRHHSKIFAKFSHDAPPLMSKKKHLTLEQLSARRRKVWLSIVKKEIPKAYKQKASARNLVQTNARKVMPQCRSHVPAGSAGGGRRLSEGQSRALLLSLVILLFFFSSKKSSNSLKKSSCTDLLLMSRTSDFFLSAKRQQRKLNFLITQTELYAHFVSRKCNSEREGLQEEILKKLDENSMHRQIDIGGGVVVNIGQDVYDSEYYKAQALKNAEEAYQIHQLRTRSFDEEAKDSRVAALRAANDSGTGFGESYSLANPSIRAGEDIPQPTIFNGKLKGYQLKGMNWLANLYEQGINGILADEMGLGKTVQSIALLAHLAERENIWGPFLIISPASTLNNWHQEFTRFVPKFKVLPYWGNPHDRKVIRKFWSQKTLYTQDAPFHVVITSYQLVVQDVKYFQRVKWQYMVLDEAQALKSSSSVRWKILLQFQCRNRLLLTGTPIQNTMAELWALLHFIMPTLFDSHEEFNEWFSKDIESHAENKSAIDENQLSRLHMILKPFMLRRIKKDVENELSDKIEILVYCQLTSRQKLLYQALKNKISIEDLLQSSMGTTQQAHNTTSSLMNLVMQFRKVCNHPELFERQETSSPFYISLKPYCMGKFLYRHGQFCVTSHRCSRWLHILMSPFHPAHIHQSLFHRKDITTRSEKLVVRFLCCPPLPVSDFIHVGSLFRWLALFLSLKASYRLQQQRSWTGVGGGEKESPCQRLGNKGLILWVNSPTSFPNVHSSAVLQNLVFTGHCKAVSGYTDHVIHRRKSTSSVRRCLITELPSFLFLSIPRIIRIPIEAFCAERECRQGWRPWRQFGNVLSEPCFLMSSPALICLFSNRKSWKNSILPWKSPGNVLLIKCLKRWKWEKVSYKDTLITDSGKLYALDALLTRLKSQGHRVLIYSQMTRMIDLLEEYMVYRQHTYMRLDGSSKISERRDMVADFQSRNDIFVFLLSTRAGGLGINLTAADTVIFYDSDWNPTVDQQAMDRAHRLGQTKQVTVYRLICKGTIEERILQRAKEKSEIQRMVISGGNFKPDTLKPKEVVSLLLDDEELEKKLRQRQEEKRQQEETNKVKERKRKREKYAEKKKKEDELDVKRKKDGVNMVIPFIPSADNSNLSADGEDSFISVDSAMPSPFSEVSMSSELQGGSIPPDESSSDMLVIVDDPTSSNLQSRATNSPASLTGSVSDTMNGVSNVDTSSPGKGRPGRGRGRPKGSSSGTKSAGKGGRSRKSTAGSAAAMAGAMAGAAAASAAAYAAYGYNVAKGISSTSPLQPSLIRPSGATATATTAFGPLSASSPLASPQNKGSSVAPQSSTL
uniref:Chromatin-remodeling ATPase INO80 n=1 Tax=Latimeria chalumnae TaxID=7897 RepID=H3AJK7_LATCH